MLDSAKQQLEGKLHEEKGALKQKAGELTNNPDLASEGETEKIAGIVQKKLGEIAKIFGS